MPATFVPDVEFVWPPRPRTAPPARPAPAAARCRKKKFPKPPAPAFTSQCRTVLIDRLEAAVEVGTIDLHDDFEPCDQLAITGGEYALLLRLLFPEEYAEPSDVRAPAPTLTAPGSAGRIAEYAERVARGERTYSPGDATAHRAADRGLRIEQRRNGSGVKVVGWDDDED